MKTTFLDYYKTILQKVSFDKNLLSKEYKKAITHLEYHEVRRLNEWLKTIDLEVRQPLETVV